MTLDEACEQFLVHCRLAKTLSRNTLRAYGVDLAEFQAFVGPAVDVEAIDRLRLRAFLQHLVDARGLKASSVKRRMACLKVMFNWLESDEVIALSPFHRLGVRIRLPKRLPRALSGHESKAVVAAAVRRLGLRAGAAYDRTVLRRAVDIGNFDAFTALVAIEVMLTTGVRVGELTGIRLRDVDLPSSVIRIHGKGDRERRVFLVDQAMTVLVETYVALRERAAPLTDLVLVTGRGVPATAQFVRKHLHDLAEEAGLQRQITPHMLRHTAATQLLEAGVDIRFVQKLLGHQSISTTEMYTAVSDESLRATLLRVQRLPG